MVLVVFVHLYGILLISFKDVYPTAALLGLFTLPFLLDWLAAILERHPHHDGDEVSTK